MEREDIRELVQKHFDRAQYLESIGKVELASVESTEELDRIMSGMEPSESNEFIKMYVEIQDEVLGIPTDQEIEERAIEDPSNFWLRDSTVSELVRRHNAISVLADRSSKPEVKQAAGDLIKTESIIAMFQAGEGRDRLFLDLQTKHSNRLTHEEFTNPGKPRLITGIGQYWTDRENVRVLAKRHADSDGICLAAAGGDMSDAGYASSKSSNIKEIKCINRSLTDEERRRFESLYAHEREIADAEYIAARADQDKQIAEQVEKSMKMEANLHQIIYFVIPVLILIWIFAK